MPQVNVNLGDETPYYLPPVPQGEVRVRVKGAEVKPGQADATKMILHLNLEVCDGSEYNGRTMRAYANTENAPVMKRLCAAAEVPHDSSGFNTDDLMAREMTVKVTHQPDQNGVIRENVVDYISQVAAESRR
jgi:hypothetical protein